MLELLIGSTHTKINFVDLKQNEINQIKSILTDKFTARDSSMSFSPMVKRGLISDKKCFYNEEYNILPTGLIPFFRLYLKKEEIEFKVNDIRKKIYVDEEFVNSDEIIMGDYIARDYQVEALKTIVKSKNSICQLSTGSGKGMIAAMICKAYPKSKILFIFDSIDLINQTYKTFIEDYDIPESEVGIVQGTRCEDEKRIVLLSMQSYEKAFRIFKYISVIVTDECHVTGRTDTAEKIIYSCQNVGVKIGLTATADLENPYEQMRLFANLGPVLYKRTVKNQINVDAISPVDVYLFSLRQKPIEIIGSWADTYEYIRVTSEKHKDKLIADGYKIVKDIFGNDEGRKFLAYGDESRMYVHNEERNELICNLAIKEKRVLLIFNRIDHGNNLYKRIVELAGEDRVMIVSGQDDITKRKEAIKFLNNKEDSIVLASTIFSKGIDVKPIETVIMCSGGKSSILVIQRVGRALRKSESTGKKKAKVIDFYDETLNKIAMRQSEKRLKIYEGLEIPVKRIK